LDWLVEPQDALFARLAGQDHRRFLKTHTSLDGVVIDPRATYIVVGRHPLDMAVSLYHQGANLDRERMRELTGAPAPSEPPAPRPPLAEWLRRWIDWDADPHEYLDSLPGGSARPTHGPAGTTNVDPGALRRPVVRPRGEIAAGRSPRHHRARGPLARAGAAATFDDMRARRSSGPDPAGIMKDRGGVAQDVGRRRRGPEPGGAGPLRSRDRPRAPEVVARSTTACAGGGRAGQGGRAAGVS
jgi:hypothetical protein